MKNAKQIIRGVEKLYAWRKGENTFSGILFDLIAKADRENLDLIDRAFPLEVFVYQLWQRADSEKDFFTEWLGKYYD